MVSSSMECRSIWIGVSIGMYEAETACLCVEESSKDAAASLSPAFWRIAVGRDLCSIGGDICSFGRCTFEVVGKLLSTSPEMRIGQYAFSYVKWSLPQEAQHLRMGAAFGLSPVMSDIGGIQVPVYGCTARAPFRVGNAVAYGLITADVANFILL